MSWAAVGLTLFAVSGMFFFLWSFWYNYIRESNIDPRWYNYENK